eukprot:1156843-Pelagomonas_calceolata.AAC.6
MGLVWCTGQHKHNGTKPFMPGDLRRRQRLAQADITGALHKKQSVRTGMQLTNLQPLVLGHLLRSEEGNLAYKNLQA